MMDEVLADAKDSWARSAAYQKDFLRDLELKSMLTGFHEQFELILRTQGAQTQQLELIEQLCNFTAIQEQLGTLVREQRTLSHIVAENHKDVTSVYADITQWQRLAPSGTHEDSMQPGVTKLFDASPAQCMMGRTGSATKNLKERRAARLKKVFERVEEKEEMEKLQNVSLMTTEGLQSRLANPQSFERVLDSVMGVAIWLNSIYLGIESDWKDNELEGISTWTSASIAFACIFWIELCFKLQIHGFHQQFCGSGRAGNIFDAALVIIDTAQLAVQVSRAGFIAAIPFISLLRLIRLIRILRLLRHLDSPIFGDLMTMIHGMSGGMLTLGWAIVLVLLMTYTLGVVCRELLGREIDGVVHEYFSSVPRSIFTIFRCSFGDCNSAKGDSIIETVSQEYGGQWAVVYALFIFFVAIGFFNVITAIFLERTMESATDMASRKQRERLSDKMRWSTCITKIIRKLIDRANPQAFAGAKLSEQMDTLMELQVKRSVLNDLVQDDPEVREALYSLDIDAEDHDRLGDIMDADHSGTIGIQEFATGMQRLRGNKLRRSDVISLDLMLRELQERVNDLSQNLGPVADSESCSQTERMRLNTQRADWSV